MADRIPLTTSARSPDEAWLTLRLRKSGYWSGYLNPLAYSWLGAPARVVLELSEAGSYFIRAARVGEPSGVSVYNARCFAAQGLKDALDGGEGPLHVRLTPDPTTPRCLVFGEIT